MGDLTHAEWGLNATLNLIIIGQRAAVILFVLLQGSPIGGHIINYLLEKSRVVHQCKGKQEVFDPVQTPHSLSRYHGRKTKQKPLCYVFVRGLICARSQ